MDGCKVLNKDGGPVAALLVSIALLMRLVLLVIVYVSESGECNSSRRMLNRYYTRDCNISESSQISSSVMQCYYYIKINEIIIS